MRSRFTDADTPPVYCCRSASEYNSTIKRLVESTDVVLEVGCQLNELTHSIARVAHSLIGVDIDRKAPSTADKKALGFYRQSACSTFHNVRMHIVDVADLRALTSHCPDTVSLIVVDANVVLGNDLPFEVLATLRTLTRLFDPRALGVKSRALASLQHQLRPAPSPRPLPAPHSADKPRRLVPISAANLVHEYRKAALAALELVPPGACALEIGAHVGETTALIHRALEERGAGGRCVGIDVSGAIVDRAKARHPSVPFEVADAWDPLSLLRSLERSGCGVGAKPALLLIDVGGLSGASGTLDALALLRVLLSVFAPELRAVVIKSSCMRTLARALKPAQSDRAC